jgi:hypothetical protein
MWATSILELLTSRFSPIKTAPRGLLAIAVLFFAASPAFALRTSENAFRIEDSKNGNLLLGAEFAEIAPGERHNNVVLLWGNLAVHGEVKQVMILSGKVVFHPESKVTGDLVVMGGSFESMPGAQIDANRITLKAPGAWWSTITFMGTLWRDHIGWVAKLFGALFLGVVLWGCGLFIFALFPNMRALTADRMGQEWGANLVAALVGMLAVPILFALLMISIIGIAALPIYFLLLGLAALVSYLAAGLWAGHRLLPPKPDAKINLMGFFLGIMILQLLWVVGGWGIMLMFVLWTLGWGSLVRAVRALWR